MATLPFGRALTVDDLEHTPDDGHRYELIDGVLVVSPAPHVLHQRVVTRLAVILAAAAPPDVEVFVAPVDWRIGTSTLVQPDVLAIPRREPPPYLTDAPLLVVEVLSPSTRRFDMLAKRDVYESAGVGAYWIVDPDAPSVTVLGRVADRLTAVAEASCDDLLTVESPFAVTLAPSDLTR